MSGVWPARTPRRRVLFLPMTDATATVHLISEDAAARGRRAGRYLALCGAVVLAASLATPEQRHCPRCTEIRQTCQALRHAPRRGTR